jgi:hypothetical protein
LRTGYERSDGEIVESYAGLIVRLLGRTSVVDALLEFGITDATPWFDPSTHLDMVECSARLLVGCWLAREIGGRA